MNTQRTIILVLSLLAAGSSAQGQVADSGAFFVRLGKDTIAVERYVRTSHALKAEAALRTPQTRAYKLDITFKDDGGVSWYEIQNNPVAGVKNPVPVMRSTTTYGADSATVQPWYAAQMLPTKKVAAKPDMIPLQLPFYSTLETALRRAGKTGSDSVAMSMLTISGPIVYQVHFGPADSVKLVQPGAGTILARMDKQGRLLALSGEATTFKIRLTRAKWADIDAYLKRYAAEEAAGQAMGPLSPRDSILTTLGNVDEIFVGYGRPSKRGRTVFGGIVPWDEVWRTGANEATAIRFGDTVKVAGATVPAGTYTLWTIPRAAGNWELIISKQKGVWGTAYDPTQDLVRVPVKTERVAKPVETFTIEFKPGPPNGSIMTMTWDRTRVVVPIIRK
jgi:hypothetical protein